MPKRNRGSRRVRSTFLAVNYRHPIFMLQNHCCGPCVPRSLKSILPTAALPTGLGPPAGFQYYAQTVSYPCTSANCVAIQGYGDPYNPLVPVPFNRNGLPAYGIMYPLRCPMMAMLGNMKEQLSRYYLCKPNYFWFKFSRDSSVLKSSNPYTITVSGAQNRHTLYTYESLVGTKHRTYKLYAGRTVVIKVPILVNAPPPSMLQQLDLNLILGAPNLPVPPDPAPIQPPYNNFTNVFPTTAVFRRDFPLPGRLVPHPWMPTNLLTKWINDIPQDFLPCTGTGEADINRKSLFKYFLYQLAYTGPLVAVTSPNDIVRSTYVNETSNQSIPVFPVPGQDNNLAVNNGMDIKVQVGLRVSFSQPILKQLIADNNDDTVILPVGRPGVTPDQPAFYDCTGPPPIFMTTGVKQVPFPIKEYHDEALAFTTILTDPEAAPRVPNLGPISHVQPTDWTTFTKNITSDKFQGAPPPGVGLTLPPVGTSTVPPSLLWVGEPTMPEQVPVYDRQQQEEIYDEQPQYGRLPNSALYRDL